MNELMLVICGIVIGACLGSWATWSWWLLKEKPVLNITVDQSVLATVTQQMAMGWAEQRGLTWQPKGAVFEPGKQVKK